VLLDQEQVSVKDFVHLLTLPRSFPQFLKKSLLLDQAARFARHGMLAAQIEI